MATSKEELEAQQAEEAMKKEEETAMQAKEDEMAETTR